MKQAGPFIDKMRREGLPEAVIEVFAEFYRRLSDGTGALIPESEIVPVKPDDIEDQSSLGRYAPEGNSALAKTAVIKLNGGLGTTMGLQGPKSLVTVKNGLSFLDITVRRTMHLNKRLATGIPLLLMNSFFTEAGTRDALARMANDVLDSLRCFLQHKFPKVLAATLEPVSLPAAPEGEWHPAGHGDLFLSLYTSGMLEELIETGHRYLFVSNIDNLGAEIDPCILGYFAANNLDFLMEVTDRTDMDRKGGHLARLKNGRLALREATQCGAEDARSFSDTVRHPFFNTNNLWISLDAVSRMVREKRYLSLPLVINRKKLVPLDPDSPAVCHLESAIGSAISLFDKSAALRVPRSRFAPVKNCDELLLVWSDAYVLEPDYRLRPNPAKGSAPASVRLDPAFYSSIDLLQSRFPYGAPSLAGCESLSVQGDIRFGRNVSVRGPVALINRHAGQAGVEDNAVINSDRMF
jgi:UTP--glucose-1-phosphate uridylyltransferase